MERVQRQVGLAFVSLYTVFLVLFGILPSAYAIFLAFTKRNAFVGVDNFVKVFKDYRFLPAVVRWLSTSVRFLSYVPGGPERHSVARAAASSRRTIR